MNARWTSFVGLVMMVSLAGCSSNSEPRLQAAYATCDAKPDAEVQMVSVVSLEDEGHTILIDTWNAASVSGVACVLDELDTPASVRAQIESTTALMGGQEAEAEGLNYTWSYHPDNGLKLVITDGQE